MLKPDVRRVWPNTTGLNCLFYQTNNFVQGTSIKPFREASGGIDGGGFVAWEAHADEPLFVGLLGLLLEELNALQVVLDQLIIGRNYPDNFSLKN